MLESCGQYRFRRKLMLEENLLARLQITGECYGSSTASPCCLPLQWWPWSLKSQFLNHRIDRGIVKGATLVVALVTLSTVTAASRSLQATPRQLSAFNPGVTGIPFTYDSPHINGIKYHKVYPNNMKKVHYTNALKMLRQKVINNQQDPMKQTMICFVHDNLWQGHQPAVVVLPTQVISARFGRSDKGPPRQHHPARPAGGARGEEHVGGIFEGGRLRCGRGERAIEKMARRFGGRTVWLGARGGDGRSLGGGAHDRDRRAVGRGPSGFEPSAVGCPMRRFGRRRALRVRCGREGRPFGQVGRRVVGRDVMPAGCHLGGERVKHGHGSGVEAVLAKEDGVIAGLAVAERVFALVDSSLEVTWSRYWSWAVRLSSSRRWSSGFSPRKSRNLLTAVRREPRPM